MLGIGSGSFDPETLVILETAFDEAWITLKTNGSGNGQVRELLDFLTWISSFEGFTLRPTIASYS